MLALERLKGARAPAGRLRVADSVRRLARKAEVRPDLVFFGREPSWMAVEVQNQIDPTKSRRWTLLAGLLLAERGSVLGPARRAARASRPAPKSRRE